MKLDKKIKVICVYKVIMPYRVGVYERLGNNEFLDFELLHGQSGKSSKHKNYDGHLAFKSTELRSWYLPVKTNNGNSTQIIMPALLLQLIRKKPDVILSEGASSLFNASTAFIYAKLFGKKFIWWSLGELKGRHHKGLRLMIDGWILFIERHSNAIFTYSSFGKKHFVENRNVADERVFVSVNVIDTEKKIEYIDGVTAKKQNSFHVIFVGSIIKVKRLEILIEAVARLRMTELDMVLDIVGDGEYLETIKTYATMYKNCNVIFHGRKTGRELSEILMSSDVLVLPGLGGLAICDGMIHSLPVICGRTDGTELDLIDDSCGFVTDEITIDFLIEKLSFLYNNRELCKRMGTAAYKRITEMYSIGNYMKHLYDCIEYAYKN